MRSSTTQQDRELATAVEDEIQWAPDVNDTMIGVAVHDGVVILTGQVPSYADKVAASRAARRVLAVGAVANDITVQYPGDRPTDAAIAASARAALDSNVSVPSALITIEVRDGFVILTGEVSWNHERDAARKALTFLTGVYGIDNRISLATRPTADAAETESLIGQAFARHAAIDASHAHVRVFGETVELTGTVSSWAEKRHAEIAAWSSPHVKHVQNKITIHV